MSKKRLYAIAVGLAAIVLQYHMLTLKIGTDARHNCDGSLHWVCGKKLGHILGTRIKLEEITFCRVPQLGSDTICVSRSPVVCEELTLDTREHGCVNPLVTTGA